MKTATTEDDKIPRKPRFKKPQLDRLKRLLDMQYKPSELADELDVEIHTVYRSYIPASCPHVTDRNGYIWINGLAFRLWVESIRNETKKKPVHLQADQAYCFTGREIVKVTEFTVRKQVNAGVNILIGKCTICGKNVFKANGVPQNDQSR